MGLEEYMYIFVTQEKANVDMRSQRYLSNGSMKKDLKVTCGKRDAVKLRGRRFESL